MCKILIRRAIDTACNFANKPVFFACNDVRMRRRVSYKAGIKEAAGRRKIAGTPRTPERKFYRRQHKGRRACLVIGGKRGGEWCTALHPERTTAARLRTVGGGYRGGRREKAGAGVEGRKEGTTRRKSSAWRIGVGAAPRACVYIYY